jgi:thiol-disulfide isomerase/thioredoxin
MVLVKRMIIFVFMEKKFLFTLSALIFGFSVLATEPQRTIIKGSYSHNNFKSIIIWSTIGKVMEVVDSTKLINGQFEFKARFYKQGMYLIGVNESNHVPILLDNEPLIELTANGPKMETNLKYIQSKLNIAYIDYIPKEIKINNAIRAAHKKEGNDSTIIRLKESRLAEMRDSLRRLHSGTFLDKLIGWKSDILPLQKTTFWNNFDFNDTAIVRCTVLNDRIQRYMRKFSKGENSGYIQCIEEILTKASINDAVYEFAVYQMITGFFESGMDNITAYLIDQKLNGESCGEDDIHKLLTKTANSIQQLTVGHNPPNFQAKLRDGGAFELKNVVAKNKFTVLMFWSSWCEHCKAAAPEIKAFHEKYSKEKITLVGYSLDNNQQMWENALNERGFVFPNIFGGKQWDSPVSKLYKVNKTPLFFVMDQNGTLRLKAKSIREVEKFIGSSK